MLEVNDALAHQIIRASTERTRHLGAFQTTMHPLNTRAIGPVTMPSPKGLVARLATGFRADAARLTALVAPKPAIDPACCAAVA